MSRPNRGPYLERNKFGVWEIRWTENRRSRSRSTGEQDLANANLILGAFLLGKDRQVGKQDGLLVREILGDPSEPTGTSYWHGHVLKNVVAQETAQLAIEKLLLHFGAIEVASLNQEDVDRYVAKRASGAIGKPSKDSTVRRELGVLIAAVNWAIFNKKITRQQAPMVKLPAGGEPRDRWLSHEEANRLEAAASDNPRLRMFLRLALATASRSAAIRNLRWQHVDLDRRLIRFDAIEGKKTKKRRVPVPISDALLPVLREAAGDPDAFVLGHSGSIRKAFSTACKRAGLADVTPHTLRHTWATWAAQQGKSFWEIAGVLGDTIQTVQDTYAHHCPEHLRNAVDITRIEPRNARDSGLKTINNAQQRTLESAENG